MFGAYADAKPEIWASATPTLSDEMKALLKNAVYAHLDKKQPQIQQAFAQISSTHYFGTGLAKTWVEAGSFSPEVENVFKTITINSPITLDFRWGTDSQQAEMGIWQLFRVGPGNSEILLQSGSAGDAPLDYFSIDLSKYLPATPPAQSTYHVRVTPSTKPKVAPSFSKGVAGPKIPGKATGPISDPVIINYTSVVSPPIELLSSYYYTALQWTLGSIHMLSDQSGPGAEEFYVEGFTQEIVPPDSGLSGSQYRFGPEYAQLDPDGPRQKDLNGIEIFGLGKPGKPNWPRQFLVFISALEVDSGGSFSQWQSAIWKVADDMLSSQVSKHLGEYIDDYIKNHLPELSDWAKAGIDLAGDIADFLASVFAGAFGPLVGMAIAVAAFVASAIYSGSADDYYGSDIFILFLQTNLTDHIESLPGHFTEDGKDYQLDTDSMYLVGATQWPSATNYDGSIEITFNWEFGGKAFFLG
jgi:hypothetical protein